MIDENFKSWLRAAATGAALVAAQPSMAATNAVDTPTTLTVNRDELIRGNYSKGFIDYVKSVENAERLGWDGGAWRPHASKEGGTKTLGYGHKLSPREQSSGLLDNGLSWKDGLTEAQATALLVADLDRAWDRAAAYVRKHHGVTLQSLSVPKQEMLVDMSFNPGLSVFPKFTAAVIKANWDAGDPASAVNQYKRHLNGKELGRNKHFYVRYFGSGVLE